LFKTDRKGGFEMGSETIVFRSILNTIYKMKIELKDILDGIAKLIHGEMNK